MMNHRFTRDPKAPPSGTPVACRLPDREMFIVDLAARRAGVTRAAYLARAAVERATGDLDLLKHPIRHEHP